MKFNLHRGHAKGKLALENTTLEDIGEYIQWGPYVADIPISRDFSCGIDTDGETAEWHILRNIDYATHGFHPSGFGCTVMRTEISVWIIVHRVSSTPYGVYLVHGAPGGMFWKNSPPIVRCHTMDEARDKAETIFGIAGSGQFAEVRDY